MSEKNKSRKVVTVKLDRHFASEVAQHRLARTSKMSRANLELLIHLQRMAFPELNKPIRMKKKKVLLIRRK